MAPTIGCWFTPAQLGSCSMSFCSSFLVSCCFVRTNLSCALDLYLTGRRRMSLLILSQPPHLASTSSWNSETVLLVFVLPLSPRVTLSQPSCPRNRPGHRGEKLPFAPCTCQPSCLQRSLDNGGLRGCFTLVGFNLPLRAGETAQAGEASNLSTPQAEALEKVKSWVFRDWACERSHFLSTSFAKTHCDMVAAQYRAVLYVVLNPAYAVLQKGEDYNDPNSKADWEFWELESFMPFCCSAIHKMHFNPQATNAKFFPAEKKACFSFQCALESAMIWFEHFLVQNGMPQWLWDCSRAQLYLEIWVQSKHLIRISGV